MRILELIGKLMIQESKEGDINIRVFNEHDGCYYSIDELEVLTRTVKDMDDDIDIKDLIIKIIKE